MKPPQYGLTNHTTKVFAVQFKICTDSAIQLSALGRRGRPYSYVVCTVVVFLLIYVLIILSSDSFRVKNDFMILEWPKTLKNNVPHVRVFHLHNTTILQITKDIVAFHMSSICMRFRAQYAPLSSPVDRCSTLKRQLLEMLTFTIE